MQTTRRGFLELLGAAALVPSALRGATSQKPRRWRGDARPVPQTVTLAGEHCHGTFTLSLGGQTTEAIPHDATPRHVSEAVARAGLGLECVPSGDGGLVLIGVPGQPFTVG